MFESIKISLSGNVFLFFLCLIFLAGYSYYIYRYTIPNVAKSKRILLTVLRAMAIGLLLFFIFEPILILTGKETVKPKTLVFVDNSRSITIEDGSSRKKSILDAATYISNELKGEVEFYSFGTSVLTLNKVNFGKLGFSDPATNFEKVFSKVSKIENVASVLVLSDGVITDGANPIFTAEKLNIPVFTYGVGDTTAKNDIEIRNVIHNDLLYLNTPSEISVSVGQKGYSGKSVNVTLSEGGNTIEQKAVALNESGSQNISFTYLPKLSGERKLVVSVSAQQGEYTTANNKNAFFVNVRGSKIKVVIVSGSPSADLSFIKNNLEQNKNYTVKTVTQIEGSKFLEKSNIIQAIDSADVFYLIGFPNKETPDNIVNRVTAKISAKSTPFFFIYNADVDLGKLSPLKNELPFSIVRQSNEYIEVQPDIVDGKDKDALLQSSSKSPITEWNNLPPVLHSNTQVTVKPESEVLSYIKVNNTKIKFPLIITRKLGSKRSVAILAKDIWKWKLQTGSKENNIFDEFTGNSIRWLNSADEKRQVRVKTSKKIYSKGEQVEFSGQVYDDSFNPIADAEIKVKIIGNSETREISLSSLGSGLYEGALQTNKSGDYSFTASASYNNKIIGADKGSFSIGDVDLEMVNPNMDKDFLEQLAMQTNGKFYISKDYKKMVDDIAAFNNKKAKIKLETNETKLWSNTYLLVIAILIFGTEWFIRKRSGML
ncbi:MAG: hypothetical protein Q8903_04200 [Bacteroidota bacterium]|nr:hypothetical protein [Bacteroidota bacterium]